MNVPSPEVLEIEAAAGMLGTTESALRGRVRRRQVPFRKWHGRLIFLKSELLDYLRRLPGCDVDEALGHARDDR